MPRTYGFNRGIPGTRSTALGDGNACSSGSIGRCESLAAADERVEIVGQQTGGQQHRCRRAHCRQARLFDPASASSDAKANARPDSVNRIKNRFTTVHLSKVGMRKLRATSTVDKEQFHQSSEALARLA